MSMKIDELRVQSIKENSNWWRKQERYLFDQRSTNKNGIDKEKSEREWKRK